MLMLLFQVENSRYAIDTHWVVEVVPRVELIQAHGMPPMVAGRLNYQGQLIPVVDLSQLLAGITSQSVLSTRIIVINLDVNRGKPQRLGLLVEKVTDTLSDSQFTPVVESIQSLQPSYLGQTLRHQQGLIQCLRLEQLLSESGSLLSLTGDIDGFATHAEVTFE